VPYGHFDVRISPLDLNHAITPGLFGIYVTFDGGHQWLQSQGFVTRGEPVGYDAVIGPQDPMVWLVVGDNAAGSDPLAEPVSIYLSRDGGLNFQRVLSATADNPFTTRTRLYVHPTNPDLLYFSFGSTEAQSRLYRYDASTNTLTKQMWPYEQGVVSSIAFNPADTQYLYLGLSSAVAQ
ncbi:MAG TPA: hypothetical protein VG963_30115, partial [Polyangiaceae bacterium]|nr:hypothetical protein [Polyangiaceae bacterium]